MEARAQAKHEGERANGPAWVRLDNASNIFLAARSTRDPKVFRFAAEMDHEVDPERLQRAVDSIYDRYPLYHAVLRRGIFWHYLQSSELRPIVTPDVEITCRPLYQVDRRNLLFRVIHYDRRIILEVFHALSDGAGALGFLADLITAYVRLGASLMPDGAPSPSEESQDFAELIHDLGVDSFTHYFGERRRARDLPRTDAGAIPPEPNAPSAPPHALRQRVYRVKGTRTPDDRTRAVELTMPATDVLTLARAEGVSLTVYLTALFFESLRLSTPSFGRRPTISASVPVNLRQFFPSTSARNFFATIRVTHTYGEGDDSVGAICRSLERQFREKATPEALERKVRKLIRFEKIAVLRVIPRPIKDVVLRLINWGNNLGLSVAVSNMGRVTLPQDSEPHVGRMLLHVTAARPQFCVLSHAGILTVNFSSPYVETDHVREFVRSLTSNGINVTIGATQVTEDELAQGAP
ncbi:MAG: alcohol acetyltransferase [Ruaniaceae bacterium]|nr:alcohol acetyltransferase [Ruaniaceae bacterium]